MTSQIWVTTGIVSTTRGRCRMTRRHHSPSKIKCSTMSVVLRPAIILMKYSVKLQTRSICSINISLLASRSNITWEALEKLVYLILHLTDKTSHNRVIIDLKITHLVGEIIYMINHKEASVVVGNDNEKA